MSDVPSLKARHNALKQHHGADAPVVIEARQDLTEAGLERRIRQIVDQAPSLREEQRARLAALLAPSTRGGGGRAA